jgi:hypothetical protein
MPARRVEIRSDTNTLSNNVAWRSLASATVREPRKHDPGDHR